MSMGISFETEDGFVLLAETQPIEIKCREAKAFLKKNPAVRVTHLYPLIDAVATFACSQIVVPQGSTPFELPRSPWIVSIGDDMHFAWGPQAFPTDSLDAAISAANQCVLITSGPDKFPYRLAATSAARDRKNVLLIETRPSQQEAWQSRIESIRGDQTLPIFFSIPAPEAA
jgi:hypothetical protein